MSKELMIGLGVAAGVGVAGVVGYKWYTSRKVTALPPTPSADPNRFQPPTTPAAPRGARVLWTAPDGSIKTYYCVGPKTSSADLPGLQAEMVAAYGSPVAASSKAMILVESDGDKAWHSAENVFRGLVPETAPPPAMRLAPNPPLPGYLSAYVTPAGEPLFRRPDGLLVKLSGIAFGTGPDNLVKNPQGQLVYLKDGLEQNPALLGFMVTAPPAPSPDKDLLADMQAKLEEAKRKAAEEAAKLLNKKIEIKFSGNRWSGPGRDYMGNHR